MKGPSIALPYLLSLKAVDLGSAVANREHPIQSKYKSPDLEISEAAGNVLVARGLSYKDLQQRDRGAGLSVLLSRILKTELNANAHQDLSLNSKTVVTYELDNSDDVFATVCEDPAFQIWLEKTIRKRHAYFVVGIQTVTDANLEIGKETNAAGKAALDIPTEQLGVKAETTISANDASKRGTEYTAESEQIYAVQYRKIVFDTFHPKDVDNAHLAGKQAWVSTLKTRDGQDDQPSMIKVALADEEPDGSFQIVSVGEGGSVFALTSTIEALIKA